MSTKNAVRKYEYANVKIPYPLFSELLRYFKGINERSVKEAYILRQLEIKQETLEQRTRYKEELNKKRDA